MKRAWIVGYFVIVISALAIVAAKTIAIDPYFHFHVPKTDAYFYLLNNQRSQNDGISRNFHYEGLITGTSMTENFKTSEANNIFGVEFVKVPYSGGSYNEINLNLAMAVKHNHNIKYIIRGLDMGRFSDKKDLWRTDLGSYPMYLYDDNYFNDVEYIFNRDVLFSRIYPMTKENDRPGFQGGITSFDLYSNWMNKYTFGHKTLFPDGLQIKKAAEQVRLSQKEIDDIKVNIRQNVTALAENNPDITFYYFFTPYSAAWWYSLLVDGKLDRQIDAERITIEEILKCNNIKLFSFNCLFDVTTDLNNYKDSLHYGEWVNSLMLRYMHEERCLLCLDNYLSYLEEERQFYKNYDYTLLTNQADYIDDYYAATLINKITEVGE